MRADDARTAGDGSECRRQTTPEHSVLSGGRFRLDRNVACFRRGGISQQHALPYSEHGASGENGRHDDQRLRLLGIDPDADMSDDGHEFGAHGHHLVHLALQGHRSRRHRRTSGVDQREPQRHFRPSRMEPQRVVSRFAQRESEIYGLNHTLYATPLPELLRNAGYHTIHVGKAHWGPAGTPGSNPYNMGFVVNIAGSSNGHPKSYLPEENFGNLPYKGDYGSVQNMAQYYGTEIHLTEAMTRMALRTLEHPIRQKQPFFLYFAHYSNHTPIQRDKRFVQKYLDAGMDEGQARYASMVEGMDKSLGDVLDFLEEKGIADNTVLIFYSDNGGHSVGGEKGGELHTQNLPLREGKGSVYEGGIRVPLMFYWKDKISAGTRINTPVSTEDFFPTLLELAGVKSYETVQTTDGESIVKLVTAGSKAVEKAMKRGEITNQKEANAYVLPKSVTGIDPEREIVFHYPHQLRFEDQEDIDFMSALRRGDWKLVYRMHTSELELYNLREDIGEHNDLAAKYPEKVKEMASSLGEKLRNWNAPMPTVRATGKKVAMPDEL